MSTDAAPPLLVLHPPGDRRGGRPWRDGLAASSWPGQVFAPDLPSHGDADPPIGGNHERSDAAVVGARIDTGVTPIAVGIGDSGWGAQLLALGGRACGLVLVDGLGAPWLDAAERVASTRRHLRDLLDDPSAIEPPTSGAPDGRLDHLPSGHGDRDLARRALAETAVPVLILASPGGAATTAESRQLVDELPGGPRSIEVTAIPDREPSTVAGVVSGWWFDR